MVVVAALIFRDQTILACQRSRCGAFPLKWEFPGGKVREGEDPRVALRRELAEELGVRAKIGAEISRVRHTYAEMKEEVEIIFFAAAIDAGEPQNRVFERMEWVPLGRLPTLDFLEADSSLVAKLASGKGQA